MKDNLNTSAPDEAQNPAFLVGAVMCSCGQPLIPCFDKDGKRIGVTHTTEDEDIHLEYWSTEKVMERIKSN